MSTRWCILRSVIGLDLDSTGTSPEIPNMDFGLWTFDFFYGLGMNQDYQLDHSLSLRHLKPFFDNVLLDHCGLPHVLTLAVHLEYSYA